MGEADRETAVSGVVPWQLRLWRVARRSQAESPELPWGDAWAMAEAEVGVPAARTRKDTDR